MLGLLDEAGYRSDVCLGAAAAATALASLQLSALQRLAAMPPPLAATLLQPLLECLAPAELPSDALVPTFLADALQRTDAATVRALEQAALLALSHLASGGLSPGFTWPVVHVYCSAAAALRQTLEGRWHAARGCGAPAARCAAPRTEVCCQGRRQRRRRRRGRPRCAGEGILDSGCALIQAGRAAQSRLGPLRCG